MPTLGRKKHMFVCNAGTCLTVVLWLGHRLRSWPSIETAVGQRRIRFSTNTRKKQCWFIVGQPSETVAQHCPPLGYPMLAQCWPTVYDVGPTLAHYWLPSHVYVVRH